MNELFKWLRQFAEQALHSAPICLTAVSLIIVYCLLTLAVDLSEKTGPITAAAVFPIVAIPMIMTGMGIIQQWVIIKIRVWNMWHRDEIAEKRRQTKERKIAERRNRMRREQEFWGD